MRLEDPCNHSTHNGEFRNDRSALQATNKQSLCNSQLTAPSSSSGHAAPAQAQTQAPGLQLQTHSGAMRSPRALLSIATLYGVVLLLQAGTWRPVSATCGICTSCTDLVVFGHGSRHTLFPPTCDFGMHTYIKSMELDSESDTFTYNTYNDYTKTSLGNCSYSSKTCHSTSTNLCGYSELTKPIIDIDCKNWLYDCYVRYNVKWGCSCESCLSCILIPQFSTYRDTIIQPGQCEANQYWYFSSIQIDSPDGDLFTYKTYSDVSQNSYYSACSSDTPVCSASLTSVTCGKGLVSSPFTRITCKNANGKPCNLRSMIYYTCADLPAGMTLPTPAPAPSRTPAPTYATPPPTYATPPPTYATPSPTTQAPTPTTPSPSTTSGSVEASSFLVAVMVTALSGLVLLVNAFRIGAPAEL